MKAAPGQEPGFTILFSARWPERPATEKAAGAAHLPLPKSAGAKFSGPGEVMVEGTIHGFPFRAALEADGAGSRRLKVNKALHDAARAEAGAEVMVEITRVGEEPEVRMPMELRQALEATPRAKATWTATTPLARRDWILWICSGKLAETRLIRIEKGCCMLASGKRRVCCFPGLYWMTKDHGLKPGETWLPLSVAKKQRVTESSKKARAVKTSRSDGRAAA
jgi:hypothetical protein